MNNTEQDGTISTDTPSIHSELTKQEQVLLRLLQAEQQARRAAEADQERLSSILDHLTDGLMIFDAEWRYRYINPQAEPFAGKPREDLLGKNVWEVFPSLLESVFYQQYHHAVAAQEAVAFRVFSALFNNWFDIRAYPIPDGLVVYFREITAQVRAEEEKQQLFVEAQQSRLEAEQAQQRTTNILESITDAFYALDRYWTFTYINRQAEPLLQRQRKDLLGKNVWKEFPEADGSDVYEHFHLAVNQQISVNFETFNPRLNTWFEVRAYPSPAGLSVYFHNINERKEVEQERERLLQVEQQAHLEAENALAVRNTFLSSVTHDLKTPLAAIKANLQLVQRRIRRTPSKEGEWITERLGAMEQALTKMTGMIDDLLGLSRIRALQHAEEGFVPLDLVPLIRAAVTEQQTTTRRHKFLLTMTEQCLPVFGNATRLDRALTNLLSNAIKYSPAGGDITLSVTKEQQDEQAWVQLSLTDQGIGIPSSDLPHIFVPFQRASNVTDRIQGTGIGLASVAQVLEQHQGTVTVTSEEGQGSQFVVRIPLIPGNVPEEKG